MREWTEKLKPITQEEIKPIDYKEINQKIWLNNIDVHQAPVLTISAWCHNHIRALHKKYPWTEWTAICRIVNHWDWQFEMVDMIHPWQKTTSWEVETTDEWMEWAIDHLLERGEDLWEWNCILHSHHSMGCFWSQTDDNARLSMNDWRMLMWAVVTAYKWEEIDYKGCLNFYKPYPIEIDCDIEYYTEDLYWQREQWGEFMENRTKEIYNEMVLTDQTLKEYKCEYDYDNLLKYLGIDITDELKKNAEVVQMKMPCEGYENRLKEIMEEAKEKVQEEIWAPVDNELVDWSNWSDNLLEQLETNKKAAEAVKPVSHYNGSLYDYDYCNSWGDYEYNRTTTPLKKSNRDFYESPEEKYCEFSSLNYPTKWSLINAYWLNEQFEFRLNDDKEWEVFNTHYKIWCYVWDELEDLYTYPEDYL